MGQFRSITYLFVIINIFNFIFCNPIQLKPVCIGDHLTYSNFDLSLLEGSWFDLGRTSFTFKENTWRNGFTTIKFDRNLSQIQFDSSGYNSFNKCEIAEPLIVNYKNSTNLVQFKSINNLTGSFKVLDFNKEKFQAIVAFCFDGDDLSVECSHDQLDIFIWSQKRPNISTNKEELMIIFNKYCIQNESYVVISDMHGEICMSNNETLVTGKIETETEPTLIAELKLTEIFPTLNETGDLFSLNSTLELPLTSLINVTSELNDNNTATLDVVINLDVLNETTPNTETSVVSNEISLSNAGNETLYESVLNTTQTSINMDNKTTAQANQTSLDTDATTILTNVTDENLTTLSSVSANSSDSTFINVTFTTTKHTTLFNTTVQISVSPITDLIVNQTNQIFVPLSIETLKNEINNEKVNFSSSIIEDTFLDLNNSLVLSSNETEIPIEPALIVFKKDEVFFDEKDDRNKVRKDEQKGENTTTGTTTVIVEDFENNSENVTKEINLTTEKVNTIETLIEILSSTTPNNPIDTLEALEKLEIEVNKNLTKEKADKNETLAEDMSKDLVLRENEDSKENFDPVDLLTTQKNVDETSEINDDDKSTENSSIESFMSEEINKVIDKPSEIESTTVLSAEKNAEELVEGGNLSQKYSKESNDKKDDSETLINEEDEDEDEEVKKEEEEEKTKKEDEETKKEDEETNKEEEEDVKEEEDDQEDMEEKKEEAYVLTEETELDITEKQDNQNSKNDSEIENSTATLIESTSTEEISTTTPFPCAEKQCPITNCNHGWKKDANNCDMCECLKNTNETASETECTTPYCHPCFYGSYTDENGCDSCACKPRPKPKSIYECPKLECPSCNYGSIKDEYGCETCICIRPNSLERSYPCPPEPTCPYGSCKHGSVLNEYGCATCDCLKSTEPDREECTRQRCPACPNGYFTDADGCETCSCKPDWMAPCALSELSCDLNKCQYGSYLDRNGCPSCECLPNPDFNIDCKQLAEINPESQCDTDGAFKVKQCNTQECRCVTKYGIPISDFKASLADSEYMNCECALALYDVSVYKAIGFKLYCAPNGNYETIQCVGGSCACVNEHGDPLGPSVPIYQKHLLRCEGVFQRVYFDQYLTTLAPTTLQQPLCLYHREKALDMRIDDSHLSVPVCDENGLYEPMQCDRHKKYCWCVNIHNGVELYGTKKTGQEPDCNSD